MLHFFTFRHVKYLKSEIYYCIYFIAWLLNYFKQRSSNKSFKIHYSVLSYFLWPVCTNLFVILGQAFLGKETFIYIQVVLKLSKVKIVTVCQIYRYILKQYSDLTTICCYFVFFNCYIVLIKFVIEVVCFFRYSLVQQLAFCK